MFEFAISIAIPFGATVFAVGVAGQILLMRRAVIRYIRRMHSHAEAFDDEDSDQWPATILAPGFEGDSEYIQRYMRRLAIERAREADPLRRALSLCRTLAWMGGSMGLLAALARWLLHG